MAATLDEALDIIHHTGPDLVGVMLTMALWWPRPCVYWIVPTRCSPGLRGIRTASKKCIRGDHSSNHVSMGGASPIGLNPTVHRGTSPWQASRSHWRVMSFLRTLH